VSSASEEHDQDEDVDEEDDEQKGELHAEIRLTRKELTEFRDAMSLALRDFVDP